MAKKALFDVLEKTIGKYVRNLDANSLNVAIWSGKIELHSLELNTDAVNAAIDRQATQAPNLALPIRVVDGSFSSFEVDVPWTHLMSRPVILRAKGLQISVAPVDPNTSAHITETSQESAASRVLEARQQSISTAEDYRLQANALSKLAEQDLEEDTSGKASKDAGFVARLTRRIIENLQIEICDVHVTLEGAEASAGVVLKSLQLTTTDKDGKPTFIDRTSKSHDTFLHKSLALRGLGAYLDEMDVTRSKSLTAIGEDSDTSDDEDDDGHKYILAPLSFTAKLRQADGNVCIDYPKYLLESELSALTVLLSKTQVELARKIQKQMQPAVDMPRPLFPEYRPIAKLTKETAREWWRYAYRCVGRLNGKRGWVEFFRAFQIRNIYIDLYKRHKYKVSCPWMAALSDAENVRLKEIEEDRSISVSGLMTWRNISDARAKKELEKKDSTKPKPSLFGSLFAKPDTKKLGEDDPPISLSPDELKELETLTLKDVEAESAELSNDSKLCDLNFVLGSFTLHLATHDMRPLSSLNMGKVSTSWKANADGSFVYDLALESLVVEDRVTPHTLFPTILSNQQRDSANSDRIQAFVLQIEKTKTGDQKLVIKLQPFELVASPILVQEMNNFITTNNVSGPPKTLKDAHPILRQSMTGSVDLFYDASEGLDLSTPAETVEAFKTSSTNVTDYTGALFDAWKAKTESNTIWIMDLDLSAPVIIVPENCSKPSANVLILNLGRLTLRYGDIQPSPKVRKWFKSNPYPDKAVNAQYDYGTLQITSLTFIVGRAQHWKELARCDGESESGVIPSDPVVAPITATMHVGIESHSAKARVATFLVLPLIAGTISPDQVARILSVSKAWQRIAASLSSSSQGAFPKDDDALSQVTAGSASSQRVRFAAKRANEFLLSVGGSDKERIPLVHLDVTLQRLSAELSIGNNHGVEAHLVSVSSSVTTFSDGGAKIHISMGWFWILDRLSDDVTRTQRLVAHSSLPRPADEYASEKNYDIIEDLKLRGVFDETYAGSSDLADVVIRHSAGARFGTEDPFAKRPIVGDDDFAVDTIVDARFTSLHVNWNPYAIKALLSGLEDFNKFLVSESETDRGSMILAGAEPLRTREIGKGGTELDVTDNNDVCVLIRAELDGVNLLLRSAIDDLPLFSMSMTETKAAVSIASGEKSGMKAEISVGNLQAKCSELGPMCTCYRTLLGVAPTQSDSLLTVSYSDGPRAMSYVDCHDKVESYGLIQLSPMRMVYIQSQILALVNYSTEGILGAIARTAASSAAAADMASAGSGEKLFVVKATGIDIVVPEAAYIKKEMTIRTGELSVSYAVLPSPGGGEAKISLEGLMLSDSRRKNLLSTPNEMQLSVILPPDGVGSADDQAMRVSISMGDADFIIAKAQYAEVMTMLSKNIGDPNLYLRPNETPVQHEWNQESGSPPPTSTLTHAGNMLIENPKRIYTTITLAGLSLTLYGSDQDDPLIRLTTDETRINADLFPNGEKLSTTVSMKNLECFDDRIKSLGREYRSMIYQDSQGADGPTNLILLEYEVTQRNDTTLKVLVGTPRIVFIPDAVSDTLGFFAQSESEATKNDIAQNVPGPKNQTTRVKITDNVGGAAIETMHIVENTAEAQLSNYSVSLVTSDCCFVFVDLGSATLIDNVELKSSMVMSATETIVVSGVLDCRLNMIMNEASEIIEADAEFHGDGFEAYTAFGGSHDALQILEPSRLSLYANTKMAEDRSRALDVRVASVTSIDLCLSMKNIALLSAILSGISDCFDSSTESAPLDVKMSQKEADHIEKLATILQQSDQESIGTTMSRSASFADSTIVGDASRSSISTKLTLPELRVVLVNDLQGLDDALFRVAVHNLVANGSIATGIEDHRLKAPFTAFSANLNCSIGSDYFDESSRSWKQLLLKPWEITVRAQRGMNSRLSARIPTTTCDIESFACQIGFTEQFLMSLAAANQMWAVYSTATTSALESAPRDNESKRLRRAIAASAARTLVTVLPYVLENHCGRDIHFTVHGGREIRSVCANSTMEYFRFPQPKGAGFGGTRLYGQDRTSKNSLSLSIDNHTIELSDVDSMVSESRESHVLPTQEVIFIQVMTEGKTVAIHVSSSVDIVNKSSIPFKVSVASKKTISCEPTALTGFVGMSLSRQRNASAARQSSRVRRDGRMTKPSSRLGVPIANLGELHSDWAISEKCTLDLSISPEIEGRTGAAGRCEGGVQVKLARTMFQTSISTITSSFDVTCRSHGVEGSRAETFVAQVEIVASLFSGLPHLELRISPRALITNTLPLSMSLRTPMPHTFSENHVPRGEGHEFDIHDLAPGDNVEVFTPGPSVAISLRYTDNPVAGNPTDWMEGGWADLALVSEFRLAEPFYVYLPFPSGSTTEVVPRRGGTEVVIAQRLSPQWDPAPYPAEAGNDPIEVSAEADSDDWRNYLIGINHYAVDHTGEVLFEDAESSSMSHMRRSLSAPARSHRGQTTLTPLGAYRSERHHGRITLLPLGKKKIRMLHLTMEGEAGYSISAPFLVDDIAICEGGVEATNIPWETGDESGFFAYRRLTDNFQSEIHIIPAYVVYNGSADHTVRIKQPGRGEVSVLPGKIAQLYSHPNTRLAISVEYEGFGARTAPMNVDTAALRFAVVRSLEGMPVGSVAIETVVGAQDSRFVVKLSDLKLGASQIAKPKEHSIIENDLIRFRVQWTELRITLSEAMRTESLADHGKLKDSKMARPQSQIIASSQFVKPDRRLAASYQRSDRDRTPAKDVYQTNPVCTILFYRFTVDWQRVFKEDQGVQSMNQRSRGKISPERSQISFIVHNVQLRDETSGSKYPVVFDSTTEASFFDLCIRTRGPLSAELINVGLVDIKLSYIDGKARPIVINLSEDFIWKLLDLANRISEAANEFTGHYITLSYDEDHEGYTVSVSDQKASFIEDESKYTPPSSTTLYDFENVQVSPFLLNFSFDRTPQKSRYERKKHVRGAHLVNYFTRQFKFKIDGADLRFGTFHASNIKGGSDRLIELLSTAYISRLKFKMISLLSAASLQDWKHLSSRQEGDDEYLEGDIMRVTGNLAGRSANYILKKAGVGIGQGIRRATDTVGNGFENAASAVGARGLGSGVNNVVSGVGQGVGETVSGIGTGAGKVLKGTGQGIGQVFGGISGGALHIGKGIGKGLQGDGSGFRSSMSAGVTTVGRGMGDGVGSVVGGAADGVATLGKGLFSGVKSIGKGFGSAVTGKPKKKPQNKP